MVGVRDFIICADRFCEKGSKFERQLSPQETTHSLVLRTARRVVSEKVFKTLPAPTTFLFSTERIFVLCDGQP